MGEAPQGGLGRMGPTLSQKTAKMGYAFMQKSESRAVTRNAGLKSTAGRVTSGVRYSYFA